MINIIITMHSQDATHKHMQHASLSVVGCAAGNFMLLTEDERSPLKAIDFGLAVPYNPEQLPRSDLGLEGTPWFMAPEVLSSAVVPASDIWSAGVMAHQLLTGRFPFDDRSNPGRPVISKIW